MLEAMARITPSQPNDAMARIASRRNRTISLELESKLFFGRESKLFSKGKVDSKRDWVMISSKKTRSHAVTEVRNFTFSLAAVSAVSPL
jgi:hypothetical protein